VLAGSGVSRGSLYHHFRGKDALFWAVLEEVGARVGRQLADATRDAPDPVAALRAECLAWIRLAGDPVVQQIALIDAPAVLAGSGGGSLTNRTAWGQSGPSSRTPLRQAASSNVT
jgi:AcrR family transcriptional regulator